LTLYPFNIYRKKVEVFSKIDNVVPSKIEEEIGLVENNVFDELVDLLKATAATQSLYVLNTS
jgi:hypothetical protein